MKPEIRIHEINMELDKTAPWEDPPYRYKRQKLNRERDRLIKRIKGRDPKWFAKGGGINDYQMKREIVAIIQLITENGGKLK